MQSPFLLLVGDPFPETTTKFCVLNLSWIHQHTPKSKISSGE